MKRYQVELQDYRDVTSGDYVSYEFTVKTLPAGETRWLSVRISRDLLRELSQSGFSQFGPLAAKGIELYLLGRLPQEHYHDEQDYGVISLMTYWYPRSNDEPSIVNDFQSFPVVDLWEGGETGVGDYNLLPHQEELLREIVRVFQEKNFGPRIGVTRHQQGADIVWDGKVSLEYNQRTLWDDLQQLASEGLVDYGDSSEHYQAYRITKASLDAVNNNFRIRPQAPIHAPPAQREAPHLGFSFLQSPDDRAIIERDYEEVQRIVTVGGHKSTIVLCGSIAEAILLERLMRDETRAKTEAATLKIRHQSDPLEQWDLSELVKVAEAMGILDQGARNLADQLRNYRNVIHPGVEKRKGFEPSPGKASAALALLELIVEALS